MKKVNNENKENYGSFYSTMIDTIIHTHIIILDELTYIHEEILFVDSKNSPLNKNKKNYSLEYKLLEIKLPKNYIKRMIKTIKWVYEKFRT